MSDDAPAKLRPVLRDPATGQVLPGSRGLNPRGAAGMTLDRAIRKSCDPEELAAILMTIARGNLPAGTNAGVSVSVRDRLAAIKLICDRGWGQAVQPIVVGGEDGAVAAAALAVADLDDAACELLERSIGRMLDAQTAPKPRATIDVASEEVKR